jgi:lysine 2,3-aminomutase
MMINPYFMNLCLEKGFPIWHQVIPDKEELDDTVGWIDPLAEERDSPVLQITHRYPDRILFLVSNICGVYCRFCTRKRIIGHWKAITDKILETGFQYIREHKEIKDVLLSGGDPLLLEDKRLEWILARIREISHVNIIRIGSRAPGVLPQRITYHLVKTIRRFQPVYLNLHFNHPDEITDQVKEACLRIADAGIPMGSQTVLLHRINDRAEILCSLFRKLLMMRVKPYYLLQADLTQGTNHFRTRIETGLRIMAELRGVISGFGLPHYVIDLPDGGGKVPLLPQKIQVLNSGSIIITDYHGRSYQYPQTCKSTSGAKDHETGLKRKSRSSMLSSAI